MEVRSGGHSGGTHCTDDLSLLDVLALLHLDAAHVGIAGCIWAWVVDLYELTVAPISTRMNDLAGSSGSNWRATGGAEVGSIVWASLLEYRVISAGIESTGDPGKQQWGA